MSEITDFYPSWLGSSGFGASGIRVRDQEPIVFKPTDVSGCVMWMDANDNDAVVYNDLLQVSRWYNKGTIGGYFDLSGGIIEYGNATQNGLNTVTFNTNGFMSGLFQFDFQDRSLFVVTRETTVLGGVPSPWITSDTAGGMESLSQHNGSTLYYIGKHGNVFPELAGESATDYSNYAALFSFINSSDVSDNYVGVNRSQISMIYDSPASGYNTSLITYFLGDYLNGSPVGNSQDMCEVILYNTALSIPDRQNVENYLMRKWGITEPPPPPPAPFVPTDISGLNLWLDANNLSTITLSGTDIVSWSNLGLVGTTYDAQSNVASYVAGPGSTKMIEFPTATTLSNYSQLPNVSRTAFVAFQNRTDLTTITYPYVNLCIGEASDGRQIGVAYDSNATTYYMTMCQSGTNCPVVAAIPSVTTTDMNLAIWASDSNTTASNTAYWNGGSNINTSTDLGNLFNTNPIPYTIGSPVYDSPGFRVGEILEYDTVLTTAQISTVADYLVNKWAISSFTTIS
jgi:hypothetical protein